MLPMTPVHILATHLPVAVRLAGSVRELGGYLALPIDSIAAPSNDLLVIPWRCFVVLLDPSEMKQLEPLALLGELARRVPTIIVGGKTDFTTIIRMMRAGAIDYLIEPVSADALGESLARALSRGSLPAEREAIRATIRRRFDQLTDEERQVLLLTIEGKPDKTIAARINRSPRTVQIRRASLTRKLQAETRAQLIRLAAWLDDN